MSLNQRLSKVVRPNLSTHQAIMSVLRRNLLILLLFTLLTLLFTWPLLPNIFTHVPGDGIDDPSLAWNLWWAKASFVDRAGEQGLIHNPFDGDSMFYPIGINLAFYTLTLFNGALSIPLQSAFSLIFTNNLLLLSSFVLSGFGAYLLTLEFLVLFKPSLSSTKDRWSNDSLTSIRLAALLSGLLYAFASAKLFYASLGQFNIASSQWLPFLALYLLRGLRGSWRWQDGFFMGLFLLFQVWAELTFGAFGVLLIALVTLGVMVKAFKPWHDIKTYWRQIHAPFFNALMAAIMFIVGLSPYLANMLPDMRMYGDFLVEGNGFSDIFSADLVGFLVPTQLHPLLGGIIRSLSDNSALRPDGSQFMVNKGQHIYPGYVVLLLALIALWSFRKRWRMWVVAALTGFFLWAAMGPEIRINGYGTGIPGIFALLTKIPFFQANRYPSRYSVMILLGLGLLAALGAYAILNQLRTTTRKTSFMVALAALMLFEHLSIPLPLSDLRLPAAYKPIVQENRHDALLDLPVGWRNGFNVFGKSDVIIMYEQWWQTYHEKPILGGNTSRNPEQKFQYFLENPVIGVLIALQDGRPVPVNDFEKAQTLGADLLAFLNIHTVLVHRDKVPPDFEQALQQLFPLQPVSVEEGIAQYEAVWSPLSSLDLTPANAALRSYLNAGWGAPSSFEQTTALWAVYPQASLLLPATEQPSTLSLMLYTPDTQVIQVELDGQRLAEQTLTPGIQTLTFTLPPAENGFPRRLTLHAVHHFPAAGIRIATRDIGQTGIVSPINIVVRSAGKDSGDFGHLYLDGVDASPNQRGYNLAAIDPNSGELLKTANFDTHDPRQAPMASTAMAAWIRALPQGTIVAGAVRDAAALNLNEDALSALQTLGVSEDIRGHLRRAHGFVGVKGAPPGTAASMTSDLWPVTIAIGDGITAPKPAFALLRLEWRINNSP